MQDGVLYAADILIDINPVPRLVPICRGIGPRCGKADEIPRRIHKGIHGVGLAQGVFAAVWAGAIAPCGMAVKRVAWHVETDIIGQLNRQVLFFFWHHATIYAMHHRDRAAPIPLS